MTKGLFWKVMKDCTMRLTYLFKILVVTPRSLRRRACVQHQEVYYSYLLSDGLPVLFLPNIEFQALDVAFEILLREVKRFLIGIYDRDLHVMRKAEFGDGIADAGCTAGYEGVGGRTKDGHSGGKECWAVMY
jgi:hypothetical protein